MTDISNWHELIQCAKASYNNLVTGKVDTEFCCHYIVVPLNEYQMGNLLDALTQATNNGDWYGELQDIIAVAMEIKGIKELQSNSGKRFTLDQVKHRAIK